MAVLDTSSSAGNNGVSNPFSWSHTCTGSDRVLLVFVFIRKLGTTPTATGVTYNAVAMTFVGTANDDTNPSARVEIWKLAAPATGANTVEVTLSGGGRACAVAISFTSADQVTMVDGLQTAIGITSGADNEVGAPAVTTSKSGDIVVDGIGIENDTPTLTAGAGQTEQQDLTDGGGFIRGTVSTEPGAASVTMSWIISATGRRWAHAAVNVLTKPPIVFADYIQRHDDPYAV